MLRITLLPNYIYDRVKRRNVIVLWSLIVVLIIVGFMSVKIVMDRKASRLAAAAAALKPTADQATETEGKATAIQTDSAAIKTKATFVSDSRKYDITTYPPVYHNIAEYTIRTVVYDSITPSGTQVTLRAFAPSLAQLGHYMMWMEHNPKITNLYINLDDFRPTYPSPWKGGNQTLSDQYVTTEVKSKQDAINLVLGNGKSQTGMGGYPSPGGGTGGSPYSGMPSSGMSPYSSPGGSPYTSSASFSPMGGGSPYSMGMGSRGGGGGGGADDNYPHYRPTDKSGNLFGYSFGVTLTLVNPIPSAPTYSPASSGSQPSGGAAGAPGGMGGMGGYPGGPGGMGGYPGGPGGMGATPMGSPPSAG